MSPFSFLLSPFYERAALVVACLGFAASPPNGLADRPGRDPAHSPRALAAHHGAPTYTLTVPTRELVEMMREQVFTDSGRFYPCRTNPSCSSWGEDIALSAPNL